MICADLSLESFYDAQETFLGAFAEGFAQPEIIDELREETAQAAAAIQVSGKKAHLIWAIHFAPGFPGIKTAIA